MQMACDGHRPTWGAKENGNSKLPPTLTVWADSYRICLSSDNPYDHTARLLDFMRKMKIELKQLCVHNSSGATRIVAEFACPTLQTANTLCARIFLMPNLRFVEVLPLL